MLLKQEDSILVLIDVQKNVINSILHHDSIVANCRDLIVMAKSLKVPIIASEHTPDSSGLTVPELRKLISKNLFIAKTTFSLHALFEKRVLTRNQVILSGIETHICILQTALEFLEKGKQVYIVVNATGARFEEDKYYALQRLQQAGAELITKEMVLFEWCRKSDHPKYSMLCEKIIK